MAKIYDFKTVTSHGNDYDFSALEGKVVLIVNTASKCGFTPQFEDLQKIYTQYKDKGLEIVGFPSGDFADQELENGSAAEEFCKLNYGVTFPIMQKVHVNGAEEEPIFTYLKSQKGFAGWNPAHRLTPVLEDMLGKADPDYKQKPDIKWNFTKFLVGRSGEVVARFEPTADMGDLDKAIAAELAR